MNARHVPALRAAADEGQVEVAIGARLAEGLRGDYLGAHPTGGRRGGGSREKLLARLRGEFTGCREVFVGGNGINRQCKFAYGCVSISMRKCGRGMEFLESVNACRAHVREHGGSKRMCKEVSACSVSGSSSSSSFGRGCGVGSPFR